MRSVSYLTHKNRLEVCIPQSLPEEKKIYNILSKHYSNQQGCEILERKPIDIEIARQKRRSIDYTSILQIFLVHSSKNWID